MMNSNANSTVYRLFHISIKYFRSFDDYERCIQLWSGPFGATNG